MRLLVAGSGGQLAGEIRAVSKERGHEVFCPPEDEFDITSPQKISKVISGIKPAVVINCAAYNDVDGAEAGWQKAFLINGIGVRELALACNRHEAVLMHFSSDYVFPGDRQTPYTIADPASPINMYGRSKLLGEDLLRDHALRFYLIRTSWVFGSGDFSFLRKLLGWASGRDSLRMVEDQSASPTYCADLARASLDLMETGRLGLYHITNSGHCSKYEWARHILELSGWTGSLEPAKSAEFKTPAERPEFSVLDNFPLKEAIGYDLPHWRDATERAMEKIRPQA